MKVRFFESDGMMLCQWPTKYDTVNLTRRIEAAGRKVYETPEDKSYAAISFLALRPEQFAALRDRGAKQGETVLEFEELKPDRSSGDRFTASIEAMETILCPDEAVIGKLAGDTLDELARKLTAADGIPYAEAFRRVTAEHPELYKQYREQAV